MPLFKHGLDLDVMVFFLFLLSWKFHHYFMFQCKRNDLLQYRRTVHEGYLI